MSRINWPCDDCRYNMGNYCDNENYSHKYENCRRCGGYEEDEDPEAYEADDDYIDQDEPWY